MEKWRNLENQTGNGRPLAGGAPLPAPSKAHATCAWCRRDFVSISALFDHVDRGHAALPPLAA